MSEYSRRRVIYNDTAPVVSVCANARGGISDAELFLEHLNLGFCSGICSGIIGL